jgi:hypothetical protein
MLGHAGKRMVSSLRSTQRRAAQDRRHLAVVGGNFVRMKVKEKLNLRAQDLHTPPI